MTDAEIQGENKKRDRKTIIETFADLDSSTIPGALVYSHGPFAWGGDALNALSSWKKWLSWTGTLWIINPQLCPMQQTLLEHYLRKHGKNAYYGQN